MKIKLIRAVVSCIVLLCYLTTCGGESNDDNQTNIERIDPLLMSEFVPAGLSGHSLYVNVLERVVAGFPILG